MPNVTPMIGRKFGRLTVIAKGEKVPYSRQATWICQCSCGNVTSAIVGSRLRNGTTKSCGCIHREELKERKTTHGMAKTRLNNIWHGMKQRCYNPNTKCYCNYGGRGIVVCNEWLHDFSAFRDWALESGYADNLSIDRVDVNGNYEPSNCRWATSSEQRVNQRSSLKRSTSKIKPVYQLYNGLPIATWKSITEASNITGICRANIIACCKGRRKYAGGYQWKAQED